MKIKVNVPELSVEITTDFNTFYFQEDKTVVCLQQV